VAVTAIATTPPGRRAARLVVAVEDKAAKGARATRVARVVKAAAGAVDATRGKDKVRIRARVELKLRQHLIHRVDNALAARPCATAPALT
jgi:hypothetical protein